MALAILALVIIGLLELNSLVTYQPAQLPPVTRARAVQAARAVSVAEHTVADVSVAAEHGRRVPFRVRMKDDDLTAFASTDVKVKRRLAARGLRDPRFHFSDGRASVSGFTKYHGRTVYVTVSGRPAASLTGRIRLTDVSVRIGKLNAPLLAKKAELMIDEMFRSGVARLPADVKQITSREGEIVLKGVSRPR